MYFHALYIPRNEWFIALAAFQEALSDKTCSKTPEVSGNSLHGKILQSHIFACTDLLSAPKCRFQSINAQFFPIRVDEQLQ